ncbi:putative restriction endonuclease [Micromonospora luteifusca]|uniref:Restriction endonuclease n=1 Tax=Micromonospora luteifusca TaxID=709860 RepID=A0ABS2M115_9ACTN|nr:HNH endonuclease [Micromonospora luteifusca]MBM7494116.1 putative restriction endonuclease [Micromonospora luteifusca]
MLLGRAEGCDAEDALQAAHIEPYSGRNNDVTNGLLLRADVHNLFDKGLMWIDDNYRIRTSSELVSRHYNDLDGKELRRPVSRADWPDKEKLYAHRAGARR